ncbi:exodeoxyribonuclease VII small subunit [Mariniblastus sp.]|nr:exodeoxyribonuclease VII small subunit [Mariniblastus sp.]MDA7903341.1 exodeoxyribonuclease VII small subunit [Mariniblastus sp.]MDB4357547.1 exodeoxyribonuclease VII small subunit [Mariniblastus sp.]MDB4368838.1 exodeoxyribonuclease VII small subunit [bacterium]MDB4380805.1 exodeoxyribonuclease VII small subunit [Mariniblastus sp.]
MAKKKTAKSASKDVPFEASLEQLRTVVGELEAGNLSLGESLEKYESGINSLKACYAALNSVQQRIELLVDLDEDGNLVTSSFDNTASEQMRQGTRRSSGVSIADENAEEYAANGDSEDVDDQDSLF